MIKKLRDRDMDVSEAEFSKPRSWGCQMVGRLRGRVVEKLRYLMSTIWESESFVAG